MYQLRGIVDRCRGAVLQLIEFLDCSEFRRSSVTKKSGHGKLTIPISCARCGLVAGDGKRVISLMLLPEMAPRHAGLRVTILTRIRPFSSRSAINDLKDYNVISPTSPMRFAKFVYIGASLDEACSLRRVHEVGLTKQLRDFISTVFLSCTLPPHQLNVWSKKFSRPQGEMA